MRLYAKKSAYRQTVAIRLLLRYNRTTENGRPLLRKSSLSVVHLQALVMVYYTIVLIFWCTFPHHICRVLLTIRMLGSHK
jgi:hypothetical protein